MTAFELIATALSLVTGLGVAVVLTSVVRAFRARQTTAMDWVPFAWVASILVLQFQNWWALLELRDVGEWTFPVYGLLLIQTLLFFLASALVLPNDSEGYPRDLREYFDEDGKWSVVALAVQFVAAVTSNVVLGSLSVFHPFHVIHLAGLLSCIAFFSFRRRSIRVAATLVISLLAVVTCVWTAAGAGYQ